MTDARNTKVAKRLITKMGGASAVAAACRCRPQSVCEWRYRGIPLGRELFLRQQFPEVWAGVPEQSPPWRDA